MGNRNRTDDDNNPNRRRFVGWMVALGAVFLATAFGAGRLMRESAALSQSATTATASGGPIRLTTLKEIKAGNFASAAVEKGQDGIQTRTLGLNGVMVEVQNAKVLEVSGPNSDTDFDVHVTDGTVSTFKTENVRFPQVSGPYLVQNPNKGNTVNLVGTAVFDVNHWEIHPIFAWQPASKGLITSMCAPTGTVSNTQQICWSGVQ